MPPMAKLQCASPRSVSGIDEEQQFGGEERKPKHRKTVAFRLEEESSFHEDESGVFGKVKCFYGPLRPELTPEENEALYLPKKQFKAFKQSSKKLALTTDEEKHKVYLNTFLDFYSNPPQDEKHVGIVPHSDAFCLPLATASVRGLERYIFPGLLQDQARTKESVLKVQASLPAEMNPQQRGYILASTSSLLSRPSRHLARVIGHADSIVALSIYKSTFLPNKQDKKKKKPPCSTATSPSSSQSQGG